MEAIEDERDRTIAKLRGKRDVGVQIQFARGERHVEDETRGELDAFAVGERPIGDALTTLTGSEHHEQDEPSHRCRIPLLRCDR